MAQIKATRMEYLKLKKRLKTAQRGHKLLKEKRDGLMKKFMFLVRKVKERRRFLEEQLLKTEQSFILAVSDLTELELKEMFLGTSSKIDLQCQIENVMSAKLPNFSYQISGDYKSYSPFSSPLGIDFALSKFKDGLETMVELAEKEHSLRLLSFEIEKTRRRVNGLEYVIIPQFKKTLKFIASKLDEQERSDKIIRMKVKDLIS
ncbi:V-type ATP synthase subunit D [Candidatus Gribaldobacteria bacterium]|nr:V-type ATP synthase subunit D [Candidatus Gribaldobacteria bacterium]